MLTHAFPTRRSSDLQIGRPPKADRPGPRGRRLPPAGGRVMTWNTPTASCEGKVGFATKGGALENLNRIKKRGRRRHRSEEHTSELQSLMRISYAVCCLKKKLTIHIAGQNQPHHQGDQHQFSPHSHST